MGTFECEVVPAFSSSALFREVTVSKSLISLAYYHGFLTYKLDKDQRSVLTSPNVVMQTVYARALFFGLPSKRMDQLESMIRTAKPDLKELERIVLLGIAEVSMTVGKAAGESLTHSLKKVLESVDTDKLL
jgi:hypothetical protein